MRIFSALIQRPEPRNMIQTLFLGKQDHGRATKAGTLPADLARLRAEVAGALAEVVRQEQARGLTPDDVAAAVREAGFTQPVEAWAGAPTPARRGEVPHPSGQESAALWFERPVERARARLGQALLRAAAVAARPHLAALSAADRRIIDYALVLELGVPAYVGGPLALADYLGDRAPEAV
jgi:hypothetical protein